MITCDEVEFEYPGGTTALRGVSLTLGQQECVALIGQNGAGKSTLSKLLNGLLRPTAGSILLEGKDTAEFRTDEISRQVGYVFQNPDDQIFSKTVKEECEYALKRIGLSETERNRRVEEALSVCGLLNQTETNPLDLPLAQRKFVAIAAVLAMNPNYVILDEPTAGLDEVGREDLTAIMEWASDSGKSVIAVSHDMRFVIENFSRIVVMSQGTIICDSSVSEAFLDDQVLAEAKLNVPPAVALARSAGAPKGLLKMNQIKHWYKEFLK